MAYNRGERPDSPMKRRGGRRRKKVCVFCGKENNEIDYKDVAKLSLIHILIIFFTITEWNIMGTFP